MALSAEEQAVADEEAKRYSDLFGGKPKASKAPGGGVSVPGLAPWCLLGGNWPGVCRRAGRQAGRQAGVFGVEREQVFIFEERAGGGQDFLTVEREGGREGGREEPRHHVVGGRKNQEGFSCAVVNAQMHVK